MLQALERFVEKLPIRLSSKGNYLVKNAFGTIFFYALRIISWLFLLITIFFIFPNDYLLIIPIFVALEWISEITNLGTTDYFSKKYLDKSFFENHVLLRTLIKYSTAVTFWCSMLLTFAFYFLLSHYQVFKDNRLLYVLVASLIPVKSILYLREQCLTVLGHTIIGKFGNAFLLNSFTGILLISLFLIKGSLGIEHFFIVYATICLIIFMITIFLYQLKVKAKYKDFNWKLYHPKWSLGSLLFFGIQLIDNGIFFLPILIVYILKGLNDAIILMTLFYFISLTSLAFKVITTILQPIYHQYFKSNQFKRALILYTKSIGLNFIIYTFTGLSLLIFFLILMNHLSIEKKWLFVFFWVLTLGYFQTHTSPLHLFLLMRHRGKVATQLKILKLILTVIVVGIATSLYGLIGCCITLVLIEILYLILLVLHFQKSFYSLPSFTEVN